MNQRGIFQHQQMQNMFTNANGYVERHKHRQEQVQKQKALQMQRQKVMEMQRQKAFQQQKHLQMQRQKAVVGAAAVGERRLRETMEVQRQKVMEVQRSHRGEKILTDPRYFNTTAYNGNNQAALYSLNQLSNKIGVIITTNGFNGIFVRQCIECYLREIPSNAYIVLYINESSDPITLNLKNEFPSIEVIYVEDQTKGGGLTGTWNKGIDLCFDNNCDIIIVSNDDILFDNSIAHICLEAAKLKPEDMIYFGPYSNKPGNDTNKIQLGFPENINPILCTNNNKLHNINGFLMVFTKTVLLKNKFDENDYFDPSYPFGGNETEWFDRFKKIGGKGMIVPKTYIYHYKLKRWRESEKKLNDNVCIYTINTGGYEGSEIYLNPNLGYDCLYFTDNFVNVYNCIKKGIIPFYVDTSNKEAKLTQRTIKTNVHEYIPAIYDKSIYIDGNISIKDNVYIKNNLEYLLNLNNDIICFSHPDRSSVLLECREIISQEIEKRVNINNIIKNFEKYKFSDNVGLTETNVLIRNHKKLIEFNNDWKLHIELCRRDQASFDFLLFKHKINYIRLPFSQKMMITEKKKHIDSRKRYVV